MRRLGPCRTRRWLLIAPFTLGACAGEHPAAGSGGELGLPGKGDDTALAAYLVSRLRAGRGYPQVTTDAGLQRLAAEQAVLMARQDRLSHDIGGSLEARLKARGDIPAIAVENIAAGQESLIAVIASWEESPAHRENMLLPGLRRMGIAVAPAPHSAFSRYWALIMSD
jgi:uncharacterized protein YkwD